MLGLYVTVSDFVSSHDFWVCKCASLWVYRVSLVLFLLFHFLFPFICLFCPIQVCFTLSYYYFPFFIILDACFFSNEGDVWIWVDREDLGGAGEGGKDKRHSCVKYKNY